MLAWNIILAAVAGVLGALGRSLDKPLYDFISDALLLLFFSGLLGNGIIQLVSIVGIS